MNKLHPAPGNLFRKNTFQRNIFRRKMFRYSRLGIRLLWKNSPRLLLLKLLRIPLSALRAFPGMYLAGYSVDMLSRNISLKNYLYAVAVLLLILALLSLLNNLLDNRITCLNRKLKLRLLLNIDEICLHMDYADLENVNLMKQKEFAQSAVNEDSFDIFIRSIEEILNGLLIFLGVAFILSKVSFLIWIPLGISLLFSALYNYRNTRAGYMDTRESAEYKRKSDYIHTLCTDFSYAKEMRLFHLKKGIEEKTEQVDNLFFRLREQRRKDNRILMFCFLLSGFLMECSLYLYLGWLVLGPGAITPGDFALYGAALRQVKDIMDNLLDVISKLAVNTRYLEEFFSFTETVPSRGSGQPMPEHFESLTFEDVTFRYPGSDKKALDRVSITISRGDSLMIVGENGAGKSTFVKLCCGLYRPDSGRILLNGTDISRFNREAYMAWFSAVFQDYKLFAESIEENLTSGEKSADGSRISYALKETGLTEIIKRLAKGPRTQLYRIFDPEGVEFSGGEMQRLAIARAICKNSDFLILDEPLSALDTSNESRIYDCFRRIASQKTVLFVSHRLSGVKFTNRILVFREGKIVGDGSHQELMENCSLYSELYKMQADLYGES